MAKLSPEELQEAKRRKREEQERFEAEQAVVREREEQEKAVEREQHELEKAVREKAEKQHNLLASALNSLYVEVGKLANKAPAMEMTTLNLDLLNDSIADVKHLVGGDPQLRRITTFEAAGNPLQYRDAVIILGQLRAALARFAYNAYRPVISDEDE